jgi:hypothetical protein
LEITMTTTQKLTPLLGVGHAREPECLDDVQNLGTKYFYDAQGAIWKQTVAHPAYGYVPHLLKEQEDYMRELIRRANEEGEQHLAKLRKQILKELISERHALENMARQQAAA